MNENKHEEKKVVVCGDDVSKTIRRIIQYARVLWVFLILRSKKTFCK
jgi:hypothetical protein